MSKQEFLLNSNEDEILNTWFSLGEAIVNHRTKSYIRDMLYRVDCSEGDHLSTNPLHNKIIYCCEPYQVDGNRKGPIDWRITTPDNVEGLRTAIEGIVLPYFLVLPAKWSSSFTPDANFIPFKNNNGEILEDSGEVVIEDSELEILCGEIGFPFLSFQDIEYSRAEICRVCIKPAMQRFWTFFPDVREEPGSLYCAQGSEFLVEFPKGAYACVPYYTTPGGVMSGAGGRNPFAFYGEQLMVGGMGYGGNLGKGIRYTGKYQPGFVGLDQRNALLDNLAVRQGFLNYFRREKYSRKRIDGTLYAYGFSTIGGNLNFKWLCGSKDWHDIPFELLEPVARPMAKSAILLQIGMLRQLVKTDIAGQLDPTVLTNLRKEIEEGLKPILNSVTVSGQFALMRGGG